MKKLLSQIALTQALPGWCTLLKAERLAAMVVDLQPEISVEVGIFGGRSFMPIALAHKFIGKGVAIGVDPWSAESASEGYTGEHKDWWGSQDMAGIRSVFLKAVSTMKVRKFTRIIQMRSHDFEPPSGIGLLHLDGQHTEQAVREVQKFSPRMLIGGLIVLDDIHWSNDGRSDVSAAAQWLLQNGYEETDRLFNKPAGGQDDWGVFRRIG